MILTIYSPQSIFLVFFLLTHVLYGWDVYSESPRMLAASLVAVLTMLLTEQVLLAGKRLNGVRVSCARFKISGGLVSLVWFLLALKVLTFSYLLLVEGVDFSTLRQDVGRYVPVGIQLILDSTIAAIFPPLLLSALNKNLTLNAIVKNSIPFVVVAAMSGSRSFALYYIFVGAIIALFFGLVSLRRLVVFSAFGPAFVGVIALIRLLNSPDPYELAWYIENDVIVPGAYVESSYNLIVFQIQDMVIRTKAVFENVPELLGYQYGRSFFFGFYSMLPGVQINPAVQVHHVIFGMIGKENTPYPPTTFAQLYLDFGYIGVVLGAMIYSVISVVLSVRLMRTPSFFNVTLFLSFCYFFVLSLYGDFESLRFLLSFVVLFALFRLKFDF